MSNEEKILQMLSNIEQHLNEQATVLNEHTQLLYAMTQQVDENIKHINSLIEGLSQNTGILKRVVDIQDRQGKILERLAYRSFEHESDLLNLKNKLN